MKYAILSDVHANESALRRVLADAADQGAEQIVCLGDIVGYGPLPKETLALVRQSAAIVLAGNHDDAVSGRRSAEDFTDLAGDAVARHREDLGKASLEWLRGLPYACELENAAAVHGDFTDPPRFNYVEDESSARANFDATDAQLMFVGHTHVPQIFLTGHSGTVYILPPQDFYLETGKRYIVNPGSVGYPREENGRCLSSYALYDSAARTIRFRFLPFSVASVMQQGRRRVRPFVVAAAALAGALIVGAAMLLTRTPPPDLTLAEKSLTLTEGSTRVRANLKIDKAKPPVFLQLEFKSANGSVIGHEPPRTVRLSSVKSFKIPAGASSAHFKVSRQTPADEPRLLSFDPSAE